MQILAGGGPLTATAKQEGVAHPLEFGFAKGAGVDFAFFLFVSHPLKPFSTSNSRSILIFDHSL